MDSKEQTIFLGDLKLIPYGKQEIINDDIRAVENVLRSDFITQGPVVPKFETGVAKYCGAKHESCCK